MSPRLPIRSKFAPRAGSTFAAAMMALSTTFLTTMALTTMALTTTFLTTTFLTLGLSLALAPPSFAGATPTPYLCPATPGPKCQCAGGASVLTQTTADLCLHIALSEPLPTPILTTSELEVPCMNASGSELCAFQLAFSLEPGVDHSFVPDPSDPSIEAHQLPPNAWRVHWLTDGGAALPPYKPKYVGNLTVTGEGIQIANAKLNIGANSLAVKTNLTLVSVNQGPIVVPEPPRGALLAGGLLLLALLARGKNRSARAAILGLALMGGGAAPSQAQVLEYSHAMVNAEFGLANPSELGSVIAGVGDLNGDGVEDMAIGFPGAFSGQGGVLLALLRHDGSVDQTQFITDGKGGMGSGLLGPNDGFGSALAILTDIDGPGAGAVALAVSAPYGSAAGAIWLLILAPDPTGPLPVAVVSSVEIPTTEPAHSLTALDDLNADGLPELALGQENFAGVRCGIAGVGVDCGAVQILHIGLGGLGSTFEAPIPAPGIPTSGARFGAAVAGLGDLDGDGTQELAVGSPGSAAGTGVVWILSLVEEGSVATGAALAHAAGVLSSASPPAQAQDFFGESLVAAGALDGNGTPDLVVGLPGRDGSGVGEFEAGSLAFLTLEPDGTLTRPGIELSGAGGEIPTAFGTTDSGTHTAFARSQARVDVNGDGLGEFFAGAATDLIESSAGLVWRLGLDDPDFDQLPDGLADNCPGVANPDQLDTDEDGVGDACDNCVDVANGANSGICVAGDDLAVRGLACSAHTDCEFASPGSGFCAMDQSDIDADGIGDACEPVVVTLNEIATEDWSLEIDCGAFNVEKLSVALSAPDETVPLNLQLGGVTDDPPSACQSPGGVFFPFGVPVGTGCLSGGVGPGPVNGIGPTVDVDSGVFMADAAGSYAFPSPSATVYTGLRPNTLYVWLSGTPRLCSAGDSNVFLGDLELATAAAAAPADVAVSAANIEYFIPSFAETSEGPLPPLGGCLINKPAPTLLAGKSSRSSLAASFGPGLFADVSPLPPDGGPYQDWEVCFKSDGFMRRVKVAVALPTGKYGSLPTAFVRSDVEWIGCSTGGGCTPAAQYPITNDGTSFLEEPTTPLSAASKTYLVLVGDRPGHSSRLNSTLAQPPFADRFQCLGTVRVHNGTNMASHAPNVFLKGDPYLDEVLPDDQTDTAISPTGYPSFILPSPGGSSSCTVPEDLDGDGVRTEADNCPYFANPMQQDQGSWDPDDSLTFGSVTPSASFDGIGDKCQCAEGNSDGKITNAGPDLSNLRSHLLGKDVFHLGFDSTARCNVKNDSADTAEKCNILDAMVLKRALETASSVTKVSLPSPPLCAAANLAAP